MIEERRGTYSYAPEGGGKVEFSTLEIYNEEIRDLLLPGKDKKLDIRQGERGLFVQDLCMEQVRSICVFSSIFCRGQCPFVHDLRMGRWEAKALYSFGGTWRVC